MMQLEMMLPALGAAGLGHAHGYWWLILAVVVIALIMPLAYFFGRHGGRAGE